MKKVLIIGASGFLGRHLLSAFPGAIGTYFKHVGPDQICLDLRDQTSIKRVMRQVQPDLVLYAAGLTDVDTCEEAKSEANILNCGAASYLASFENTRMCYFSTDYVFDGKDGLYIENANPNPVNHYGASKLAGERAVLAKNPRNIVIRVSGLYDWNGTKRRCFEKSGALKNIEMADDTRISNPIHVGDVCSATRAVLEMGMDGIFHAGGPDNLSRYEFAQIVALHVPDSSPVVPIKTFPGRKAARPSNTALIDTRLNAAGWQPRRVAHALHREFRNATILRHERRTTGFGILIDCVGGLLTRRTWLGNDSVVSDIDMDCGSVTHGEIFWDQVAQRLASRALPIDLIQDQIVLRYVPNPDIWRRLRDLGSQFQLALVNNGAAATFRRWVDKYGLEYVFDFIGNSEELGIRKPESAFFTRVAEKLGLSKNKCLLIDDDPENVNGAIQSGLYGVLTKEHNHFPVSLHSCDFSEVARLTGSSSIV